MNRSNSQTESARPNAQHGIALLVAMFALLILTLIGLGMLTRASTEILINENFKRSRAVYYTAEGGTEEARYRLTSVSGANRIDNLFTDAGASNTVVYLRANPSIDPTNQSSSNRYRDSEYATISTRDQSGSQTSTTSTLNGATPTYLTSIMTGTVPYSWVKITRKTELLAGQNVDSDTSNQSSPVYYGSLNSNGKISQYVRDAANAVTHSAQFSNPVFLVTAMGLDSTGAQRKIQTEVVVAPPVETSAAINSYEQVDFQGQLNISGYDECYPGDTSKYVWGVSSNSTIDNPNGPQVVNGRIPPPPAPQDYSMPSTCAGCGFNYDVPTLISSLKNSPMFKTITTSGTGVGCSGSPTSCTGSNVLLGTPPNVPPPGTATNSPVPGYYYAPGDLHLTGNNSLGYGILVVDGDVTFNGGVYFEGIIIARGTFNFTGGGGNNINIRGAVIAGDSITDSTSDVGGSIEVQYNSCSILNVYNQMPMTVLTFKDRALY